MNFAAILLANGLAVATTQTNSWQQEKVRF